MSSPIFSTTLNAELEMFVDSEMQRLRIYTRSAYLRNLVLVAQEKRKADIERLEYEAKHPVTIEDVLSKI